MLTQTPPPVRIKDEFTPKIKGSSCWQSRMLGGKLGFLKVNEVDGNFMETGMEDSLCIRMKDTG